MDVHSTLLDSERGANSLAYDRMWEALTAKGLTPEKWSENHSKACAELAKSVVALLAIAPIGTVVFSFDGQLTVASFNEEEIMLTADGGKAIMKWHAPADEPMGDSVMYERWSHGVRQGHGYIDPVSRCIVQTG